MLIISRERKNVPGTLGLNFPDLVFSEISPVSPSFAIIPELYTNINRFSRIYENKRLLSGQIFRTFLCIREKC